MPRERREAGGEELGSDASRVRASSKELSPTLTARVSVSKGTRETATCVPTWRHVADAGTRAPDGRRTVTCWTRESTCA